jgi:uncharacterized membrane protein
MTTTGSRAAGEYLRFLAWVAAVTTAVALLGYVPTRRLGGEAALLGMVVGCGIGVLASMVGALPLALAANAPAAVRNQALFASMGLRFVLVLAMTLAAALSGRFEQVSLLLWVAISYVAQLVVDTRYALKVLGDKRDPETS